MVYKKIVLAIILTIIFAMANSVLLHARHNKNHSKELNEAIINLVEQLIEVKYETHCTETLEKIFTEELLEIYDDIHPHFFREESFYFVNRTFMRSLYYLGDNQWSVIVRIHEGFFLSRTPERSFWLYITIIKTESGSYLINYIARNA